MGKLRRKRYARHKGDHGLPVAFIASAYFSSRPYLEAQVVYMNPMTPWIVLAAERSTIICPSPMTQPFGYQFSWIVAQTSSGFSTASRGTATCCTSRRRTPPRVASL